VCHSNRAAKSAAGVPANFTFGRAKALEKPELIGFGRIVILADMCGSAICEAKA
jgi:hypothetical protein